MIYYTEENVTNYATVKRYDDESSNLAMNLLLT